jgi:hypothetical protein
VTREGVGTGKAINETGIKKAEHDALKRAAVKFGIARELYKKEFDTIDTEEMPQEAVVRSAIVNPVAKTVGDMVTGKQLGLIRSIARETGINVDQECSKLMQCSVGELSKRAASDLIEHLQSMQRDTAVPMRRVG